MPAAKPRAVSSAPTYEAEALYSVTLSAVAEYRGSVLSPMHNPHTVKGKVAEAIADKIADAVRV